MELENMDRAELEENAELLNIKFTANMKDATLRNKISEALGEPTDEPEPELSNPNIPKDERIVITVNESETDKQPVPVSVNGKNYVIKRGVKVAVPKSVIEVLNHAKKTVWSSDMEKYHEVPRYPYQVHL